nr:hypothetical protein [Halorubrum salsamenti]
MYDHVPESYEAATCVATLVNELPFHVLLFPSVIVRSTDETELSSEASPEIVFWD